MKNIMQCLIGKAFGCAEPLTANISSPFHPDILTIPFNETSPPFPSHNFDRRQVTAFRDYLNTILDEEERIRIRLGEMND